MESEKRHNLTICPQDEYKALRDEILQGRKYVFERPLLIVTVSFVILKFLDEPFILFVPILMIGLLIFNLWFTVNRMKSLARIVSYIQLVLEEINEFNWIGWESSVRYQRIWTYKNKDDVKSIINKKIDKGELSYAMGYYPVIYYLHIGIVLFVLISCFIYTYIHPSIIQVISMILTSLLTLGFIIFSFTCHPNKTRNFIEENRIIWKEVFTKFANTRNVRQDT